ncbi:zinc finger matrin-type protein 5 [Gadus macrocephalus]|uniref:zinc finger matrin-type protein 5 n=1 Tax=Gadus macrocephalus TaxID=80720 RepID=UPI0028CB30C9|nr:zinc finger matrin-type protein 5 [Gadus macrocephalus]XP_059906143.1 zinc finger matrin-type protein 5 [Gadus macrocephalus]
MGRRYYCDYCDRSFQDNMHNRKKHLFGVQHHRSKKAWFDHFRDTAAILQDEQAKKPCRKFLQTGNCGFGPSCRFSHMSEEEMEQLRMQIEDERSRREDPQYRGSAAGGAEEWLAKRQKRRPAQSSGGAAAEEEEEEEEEEQTASDVVQHLLSVPDLPPSLRPPPPGGWRADLDTAWG